MDRCDAGRRGGTRGHDRDGEAEGGLPYRYVGPELDIQPGFHCDNGKSIRVGKRCTANFNVTILDGAPVTFGGQYI